MGIIDRWIDKRVEKKMAQLTGSRSYQFVGGQLVALNDNAETYINDGYAGNDIVYAALQMVSDNVKMPSWALYKVQDESSLKEYKQLTKEGITPRNYKKALRLHKKSFVEITSFNNKTGKINDLLKWCNDYETFQDLVANGVVNKMLLGNKLVWADILDAGANKGLPQAFWNLPSQYISMLVSNTFPQKIAGYKLTVGQIINFTIEQVLHERYYNPVYDTSGSQLWGQSPLKAALKTLNRNNKAKTAAAAQYDNGGSTGIVYIDDNRLSPDVAEAQAKAIKSVWSREYSGADNFGKTAHSGYKTGFTPITFPIKDMAITEMENLDHRRLFSIWGIPSELGNDPDNKSFNNKEQAEIALINRCVLPRLYETRNHFNRKLQNDWGFTGENVVLDFDMSCFSVLETNMKDAADWLSKSDWLTMQEKREYMGYEEYPDPLFDQPFISAGQTPLSDLTFNTNDATGTQQGGV